jgi:chromosome segregation ATPase
METDKMNEETEKPGKPGKPPAATESAAVAQRSQSPPEELTPTRIAKMEAGLRAYHDAEQQIETLQRVRDQLLLDVKDKDLEIRSLNERLDNQRDDHQSARSNLESRLITAEAQRDQAVAEATALKTFLSSMKAIWDRIPNGSRS